MKITARILNILLALLILAGLAGTGLRVLEKYRYDESNFSVNVIMDYDDAVLLPGSGDPGENLEILSEAGFSALMMSPEDGTYDKLTLEALRYYDLQAGFLTEEPFVAEDYMTQYLMLGANYPLLIAADYEEAGSLSEAYAAGMVIAREQGMEDRTPTGYGRYISMVRVEDTLAFENDTFVTEPLVQSMARAVIEDGARVLYIQPLLSEHGEEIIGVSLYARLMAELSEALRPYGFELNDRPGTEVLPENGLPALLIMLGVCAAIVLLVSGFRRVRALFALILLGVLAAASAALWVLMPDLLAVLARYGALLVTPPLAMYYYLKRCRVLALSNGNRSLGSVFWYAVFHTFMTGLISFLGCLAGALCIIDPNMTTPGWFVPAVWAVTLVCTLVIGFRLVYREKGATVGEYFYAIYDGIVKNKTRSVAVLLIAVTAVLLYVFVVRPAPTSPGDVINAFIERWLVVHPNLGMYLLGIPSVAVSLVLCGRRMKGISWIFLLLATILPASFAVYFVSAALPLQHILIFSCAGMALGMVLSLLLCVILTAVLKSVKFRGRKEWRVY